ncbi:putative eukaryotic translation initiation factor 3, gamma subunit [Thermoascus aurantiacus ATCC 26904]
MHSCIRPHEYVALRLPSDVTKVIQLTPNTNISLGKYGSFPANQIIGRPFYLTFEIQDEPDEDGYVLRVVSAAELHAEALITEGSGEADGEGEDFAPGGDGGVDVNVRDNRDTIDDGSTQKMTLAEIEALKKQATGAGREIIARLLESHSALDQKTAFSLAKYTLRKRKKFLKRFTVLPVDVGLLTQWMLEEKDAGKIMELRDEHLGLIGCWGNVHHGGNTSLDETVGAKPNGRYLIVDDTGGLVVAAMAERMGILYRHDDEDESDAEMEQPSNEPAAEQNGEQDTSNTTTQEGPQQERLPIRRRRARPQAMSATSTTLTVIHAHTQPNLTLLKYFGFDASNPDESHPLHTHLKTLSWLQLVDPAADPICANEPATVPDEVLASWKPSKRSLYHRKRQRFARVRRVVDETRAGGFDGLIVASLMEPASILKHAVPLLAGSAPVVVYSPTIEPLVELVDLYSTARRTAYINLKRELEERQQQQQQKRQSQSGEPSPSTSNDKDNLPDLTADFPVDPTLLLAPSIQTSRVRPWQVLPGRTHPLMSGRGGAEGYIFHATRVIPSQERIEARGNASRKKRKVVTSTPPAGTSAA